MSSLDWDETTIGKVCSITTGKLDVNASAEDGTYPFFTCAEKIYRINDFAFDTEAVLFAGNGFFNVKHYKGKFNAYQRTYVLHELKINGRYLFHYISYRMAEITGGSRGSTIKYIRLADLRDHPIRVPNLETQIEIVAEIETQLSRLDEAVANLQRVKANLKRYKASVLKAAVEGRLVETEASIAQREGRSYETGEQLLQRILEERQEKWAGRGKYKEPSSPDANGFCVLPEGWVWASGDQLTSVITDGEHITPRRTPDGVLLLSARNVLNGSLALEDVDYVPEEEYERIARRIEIQAGDVLLSCSGTVGRSCVVPFGLRFTLVRSVAVLRPVIVLSELMAYMLQSPLGQSQIDDRKTQTAQANLFQGKIRQLVFALPPFAEQVRIVAEVDRQLTIIHGVEAEVDTSLQRAKVLRQTVLTDAFKQPGISK